MNTKFSEWTVTDSNDADEFVIYFESERGRGSITVSTTSNVNHNGVSKAVNMHFNVVGFKVEFDIPIETVGEVITELQSLIEESR